MDRALPTGSLAREAGLAVLPTAIPVREGRAWLADWQGCRGVLRARTVSRDATHRASLLRDVAWLHEFLAELARLGFPSPQPLRAFGGRSWAIAGGELWELVSFIPGREVGWDARPRLEEIGGLLARYHAAASRIPVSGPRPGVIPLAAVPPILQSGRLEVTCLDPERAAVIRRLAGRLAADLARLGDLAVPGLVIHGDFTCHNVIAAGRPPRLAGVIDFQRAHVETPVADIGYGLWRSGRPRQDSAFLDLGRLTRFVRGYARTAALTADAAAALPVYLYGRGLQMIARRVQEHQAGTGMLDQVQWTAAHAAAIADAAVAALP